MDGDRQESTSNGGAESEASRVPTIRLDQFLKFGQLVGSGGEAKVLIQQGAVAVNGETERRRGRKLRHGDTVVFDGETYDVHFSDQEDAEGAS